MRCPKCSCPLEVVHLAGGIDIESCPHCAGAFYDAAELARPIEANMPGAPAFACPKCGEEMKTGTLFEEAMTI